MTRWLQRVTVAVLAFALAGCGGDAVKPVAAEDLQQQIAESVADQMDASPSVLCPAALAARVGAQTTCKITGGTAALIATAKVTAVDVKTGKVSIAVSVSEDVSGLSDAPQTPAETDQPAPPQD